MDLVARFEDDPDYRRFGRSSRTRGTYHLLAMRRYDEALKRSVRSLSAESAICKRSGTPHGESCQTMWAGDQSLQTCQTNQQSDDGEEDTDADDTPQCLPREVLTNAIKLRASWQSYLWIRALPADFNMLWQSSMTDCSITTRFSGATDPAGLGP